MFKTFVLACRPYAHEKNTIRMDWNDQEWSIRAHSAQRDLDIMVMANFSVNKWSLPGACKTSLVKRSFLYYSMAVIVSISAEAPFDMSWYNLFQTEKIMIKSNAQLAWNFWTLHDHPLPQTNNIVPLSMLKWSSV